ncbi:MAG: VOC family protein [Planctomycetota bacterium]|jgi:predicted enzyme related to lactoylglutathione lyase
MGNAMCHWELMVTDIEKAKAFYGQVFDWQLDESSMPGYTLIQTGKEPGGGIMLKPAEAPVPALHVYFLVEDIEATLSKVSQAGGQVIVPKTEIPNIGHFAMFMDPDNIPVGIFQEPR